jgi:SAM-dependent methyltransferase
MEIAYPIGENESQTHRLVTQAQLYDPFTRAFFQSAGIGPGMKVLELGSGVGDVTLLLAELVGPSGRIRGVELKPQAADTARLRVQSAGWQNIEFTVGDIESIPLEDGFDAVVGRFVLMWLPDPRAVLRRVVEHLHPGGIVAFQDNDFSFGMSRSTPLPLLDRLLGLLGEMQSRGGPDFHMGLKLHRLYQEAGLFPPQFTLHAPIGAGPSWTGYQFIAETVGMVTPLMQKMGVAVPDQVGDIPSLAEQIRNEAVAKDAVIILPALIGAWSRKP